MTSSACSVIGAFKNHWKEKPLFLAVLFVILDLSKTATNGDGYSQTVLEPSSLWPWSCGALAKALNKCSYLLSVLLWFLLSGHNLVQELYAHGIMVQQVRGHHSFIHPSSINCSLMSSQSEELCAHLCEALILWCSSNLNKCYHPCRPWITTAGGLPKVVCTLSD